MDREEALKLLRGGPKGIAEWNRRRKAGEKIPELNGVDLDGAHLCEADLNGAIFSGACLHAAALHLANLCEADLQGADLSITKLIGASLIHADLDGATLVDADLHGARLGWTNFVRANLRQADFTGARCHKTLFVDVDLSQTRGLETIRHVGPSTLGIETLYRSKGRIPRPFLEGCGLPDAFIEYIPSIIGAIEPIQFYSCFISHSSSDAEFCKRLYSRMRDEKIKVWYAPEDLKGGEKLHEQLQGAIRLHDKQLLVISEDSLRSDWVKAEIRWARKEELRTGKRVLFPIRLCRYEVIEKWSCWDATSKKDLGDELREYFIPDFAEWKAHDLFEEGFGRLLRDLKAADPPGSVT